MKKRICIWLLALCMLFAAGAHAEESITVDSIQKYGNLVLSITGSDFLRQGYTYGDVVTVRLNGGEYDMPVGSLYSDVDTGSMVCRVLIDAESGEDYVILAINMGDLATTAGIAVKTAVEQEPGYRWDYLVGEPVEVGFDMKEAGGYLNEFLLRHLVRTNERGDYPHLTDAQYANFRPVVTSGMGEGKLLRSSSPVNPELNRSAYADAALKEAGVQTVINLADSAETMRGYEGFASSAYSGCNIIALNLGIDFHSASFRTGMADGLRFMAANEGPYLVHCTEGKDRAGFVSAVLECLMGASAQEVLDDYMITYANYYGVESGTEKYAVIAEKNIQKTLEMAFEIPDLYAADLAEEAEAYLLEALAMTREEIGALRERLS